MLTRSGPPILAVCMIVRNEEANLARCLQSIKQIAHEIVVIDTGSTDRTIEIAQSFGAKIGHFAWGDDFSEGRNAALELATSPWVLSIDADEWLDPSSYHPLRVCMSDPSCCYSPVLRNESGSQTYLSPRVFPREGARWHGMIHEAITFDRDILPVPVTAMVFHTQPPATPVDRQRKRDRNRQIFSRLAETEPKLAEIYDALDSSLEDNREEAIDKLWHVAKNNPDRNNVMRQVFRTLASQLIAAERFPDVLECIALAEQRGLDGLWSVYIQARIAYLGAQPELGKKLAAKGLALQDAEGPVEQMRAELRAIREGTL